MASDTRPSASVLDSALMIAGITALFFFWGSVVRNSAAHSIGIHVDLLRSLPFEDRVYHGAAILVSVTPVLAVADLIFAVANRLSRYHISAALKAWFSRLSVTRVVLLMAYLLVVSVIGIGWLTEQMVVVEFYDRRVERLVLKPDSRLQPAQGELYFITRSDHDTVFVERNGTQSFVRIVANDEITEVVTIVDRRH